MSTESPAQAASADLARTNAGLAAQLNGVALPELAQMISVVRRELGSGGEPQAVKDAYGAARSDLNRGYANAAPDALGLLRQQALQSGERVLGSQVQGAYQGYVNNLEQDRSAALKKLQFSEANAGLGQYNALMNMLGQGAGAGLNLGRGYSNLQAGAIGGMSQSSPFGSALGGAASGAALGSNFGPYGAAIGGVFGGALGYVSGS